MPQIGVSDDLYEQIRAESAGEEMEATLWEMVGSYRRQNNPEADPN
ncbi:hypothetical protein [Halapricum sp. CBA1109]|nr:hypothetical protein [Halapricum sp. CBA1109]